MKDRRDLRTNSPDAEQHCRWRRCARHLLDRERIPFGLHSLDLLEQLETVELTGDLGFDVPGERTAIARVKFFKTRSAITTQRLTIPDALTEEQSLHAVDVENPLGDQHSSLAANPAAILFLARRHPDHRTDTWLSPLPGHQRAKQRFAINPVGLYATAAARYRDRRGVDNLALNPSFVWITTNG